MPSVIETAEAVRRGERRAIAVLEDALAAIETLNPIFNAFVHLDRDGARRAAQAVDRLVAQGRDPGPLAGVPFGMKDYEDCAGMPTSMGSLLYRGRPPAQVDAVHVARLRAAGAVPVGKTATAEFGLGASRTKACGITRNPWNPARTPGGSSCGSAAAVAAGMTPFCTAADYGGSTRIPAAWTGLVGLKPSHGRIPNDGQSDIGCAGALTTTVADTARYLDAVSGPDDRDRMSLPATPVRYERMVEELDVRGLRAAWSPDLGYGVVEPEVIQVAGAAAAALIRAAELEHVDVPVRMSTPPFAVWLLVAGAERRGQLELDGLWPACRADLCGETRFVVELAERFGPRDLAAAHAAVRQMEGEVAELFRHVDVLLTPTVACAPFAADGMPPSQIDGRDAGESGFAPFSMFANFCWNPAISVPAGSGRDGLPIGLQIAARRHADEVVLRLARVLELRQPWPRLAPCQLVGSARISEGR